MMLTTHDLDILKAALEHKIGRKILTSKDCIDLSEAIFRKIGYKINSNTLRRFFGLVKSEYQTSVSTLNMLAEYCGASSFADLITHRAQTRDSLEKDGELLLKYLINLFQNINVSNAGDPTLIRLTHGTIDFLNQNPDLAYKFQKAIAKTNNGVVFYFEQFVNIDKLASFYGKGLDYYLAENKTPNGQIFGNALLCLRYWLCDDIEKLGYCYLSLMKQPIAEDTPLSTSARYFAARLFYNEAKGLNATDIIQEANEFYENKKSASKNNSGPAYFELFFAEALILTGHYYEALVYTNEGYRRKTDSFYNDAERELFKGFKLYHAIVLLNLDNTEKAAEIYDRINTLEFYFIKRQFQTILYLLTGMKLNKLRAVKEQLDFLLGTTGFKRMASITGKLNAC